MGTRLAAKLNVTDVGDPLAALAAGGVAETDTKTIAWLGHIMGMARGLSYRSNNFGDEPSIALIGVFESVPYDPANDVVRAPSLFMPRAIQAILTGAMLDGVTSDLVPSRITRGTKVDIPVGKEMKILFEVGCRRNAATGGAGYEFVVNQVGEVEKIDTLEKLRVELTTAPARLLAAAAPKQIAAPATADKTDKPAGKGKGKGKTTK